MAHATFKLVEECSGVGDLIRGGEALGRVQYRIDRYQGMLHGSGMPIPGLHRIEGSVDMGPSSIPASIVGSDLTLRLDDGRTISIVVTDTDGRVLAEGHGPGRGCSCC